MRKAIVFSIAVAAVLMLSTCSREEQPVAQAISPGTSAPEVRTQQTITTNTQTAVTVEFSGLVAHVFGDQIGERNRAVVMKDVQHPVYIEVPGNVNKAEIPKEFEVTSTPSGRVQIKKILGYTVRVVGWDKKMKSSVLGPLIFDATFEQYVPNVLKASGNTLDRHNLKPQVFNATPEGSFALFVPLDGGTLTATKYCKPSKFTPDHDNQGLREFAKTVTQTGTVVGDPAIQFLKKNGNWQTATFTGTVSGAVMSVHADYAGSGGGGHFHKFRALGSPAKFAEVGPVECPPPPGKVKTVGVDPSCSNSQWP